MKDVETWLNKCHAYEKNKEALGFNASVVEKGEGLSVKTDIEKRYKKSLSGLITEVLRGAMYYALTQIPFKEVKEEDQESYFDKWEKEFMENKLFYLNVLLQKGLDAFMLAVMQGWERHETAYFLMNIRPSIKDGNILWEGPNGFFYNGNAWVKDVDGGTMYHSDNFKWDYFFAS